MAQVNRSSKFKRKLKSRMRVLGSHSEKCESAATQVKTPEKDSPDSTVRSSQHEASDMSSCTDEDEEYKPPAGSPGSSSSCSTESIGSSLESICSSVTYQAFQSEDKEQHHSMSEGSDGEDPTEESVLEQPAIKKAQKRHLENCTDEAAGADEATEETVLEQPAVKKAQKRLFNKCTDEATGADEPTEETVLEQPDVKKVQRRLFNKCIDESSCSQGVDALRHQVSRRPPETKLVGHKDVPKKNNKRLWSEEEKSAVERRMAKFVALGRVPGKEACSLCITQESPALNNRTWKDVKYFVYNEIIRGKKQI